MKLPSVPPPTGDAPESGSRPRSDAGPEADAIRLSPARSLIRFFRRLWTGDLPLRQVFWHDMLVVGTSVNIAAMGLAFLAVALGASTPVGIAIHLSPVPYNILLVASVWRRAGIERSDWSALAQIGAVIWLVLAFVI